MFPTTTVFGGILDTATQPLQPADGSLINALDSVSFMGSNIVLTGFSAGSSDIAATWNSLPLSTQNSVIAINLVSPGMPWPTPNFTNANGSIPTYTFQSLNSLGEDGFQDNLVNDSNYLIAALSGNAAYLPIYPGGVTQIAGAGHNFGKENAGMGILPASSNCP